MTDTDPLGPECDLTGLPRATCDHCRPTPPRADQGHRAGAFHAQFPGSRCRRCGELVAVGELIRWDEDRGGYAHTGEDEC